jgi:hypothetical protein
MKTKLTKAQERELAKARKDIQSAIASSGGFRHNWVSSVLRCVDQTCGQDAANALIDEFELTAEFGIRKVQ